MGEELLFKSQGDTKSVYKHYVWFCEGNTILERFVGPQWGSEYQMPTYLIDQNSK